MKKDLVFDGMAFTVVNHEDQPCLTLPEIAQALYGKGGVQSDTPFAVRVRKLYSRHADEFTDSMTAVIKLQTSGGVQDVRVFSLRGAHLLGMLARTEAAKKFRRWALDVIDEHLREQRGLVPQYHAAVARLAGKQSHASMCGKGLRNWREEKPSLLADVKRIEQALQMPIFPGLQ